MTGIEEQGAVICTCHHHHCAHHRQQQQEGRREKSSLMLQLLRRAGLHLWDSQIYENTTKSATRELLDAHRATWDGINASVGRAANGLEHLWPGGQLLEECIVARPGREFTTKYEAYTRLAPGGFCRSRRIARKPFDACQ
jgi:hypothetical protein